MSDEQNALPEFVEFASIARLTRDIVVTEKIDGANAQVHVTEDGRVVAGSRNRWVPLDGKQSHFGFEKWVAEHAAELRAGLGVGSHYGEWWGSGIQRRYGLTEKRFSLFNVGRWTSLLNQQGQFSGVKDTTCVEVPCCHVVPILTRWTFDTVKIHAARRHRRLSRRVEAAVQEDPRQERRP